MGAKPPIADAQWGRQAGTGAGRNKGRNVRNGLQVDVRHRESLAREPKNGHAAAHPPEKFAI